MHRNFLTNCDMHSEKTKYCLLESSVIASDYVVLKPSWCIFFKDVLQHRLYQPLTKSELRTSWIILSFWMLLSILVACTSTAGFVETEWFVRENISFLTVLEDVVQYEKPTLVYTTGMFNVCYKDTQKFSLHCHRFGLLKFPSSAWQGSCLLYGMGCVLQGCGLFVVAASFCLEESTRKIATYFVSCVHVIGGVFQTISLFLYPLILDTHIGRLHCGDQARAYSPDQCRIGWAYVTATSGTLLTFCCPMLAHFGRHRGFHSTYSPVKDFV